MSALDKSEIVASSETVERPRALHADEWLRQDVNLVDESCGEKRCP